MFELATQGKSDREVARALNASGYRTSGNRGPRPFTKDSVRGVLTNRFYVGELTDGNGGWVKGRHTPLIALGMYEEAQRARARNRSKPRTIRRSARAYSLSGLLRCVYCEGPVWIHQSVKGRPRVYCRDRAKGSGCVGRGTFLEVYEAQLLEYLRRFVIPENYRTHILAMYRALEPAAKRGEVGRVELTARLERIKRLYEWGDKPEADYLDEKRQLVDELARLAPEELPAPSTLSKMEEFLTNLSTAWVQANPDQRNRLARQLFDAVWVQDEKVVRVRPRPELRPFFQISEECQSRSMSGDPDRIRTGDLCLDRAVC